MTSALLSGLESQVSRWPGISVRPHRFGGSEFLLGRLEVGHAHEDGALEIPFPRALRDQLLAEGLVVQHRWRPNSGWVTFWLRNSQDLEQGLRLLRLSYLRYVLKAVPDPGKRFELESDQLRLSPQLKTLLRRFAPLAQEMVA